MKQSGKVKIESTASKNDVVLQQSRTLDKELLIGRYRERNPQFDTIYKEYCGHARLLMKSKSTEQFIPEFNDWVDQCMWIHHEEVKIYLPANTVTTYKNFFIEADTICHSVTYIPFTSREGSDMQHGSYVRILEHDTSDKTPKLGQIDICFTHEFETRMTKFIVVRLFEDVRLDPEGKLWWVPIQQEASMPKLLLTLTHLSPPLVTARLEDEKKLWFLTIKLYAHL